MLRRRILGRKIKSALFIDFDNVVPLLGKDFASSIPKWMAWLEDGGFDEERRRRTFQQKRVYWNSHNEGYRRVFEEHGFEAQACPARVRTKKSTADMVIAIDVMQMVHDRTNIEEYVLLTTDTDFVTLIDKLDELGKKTVAGANEKIPTVYTVFVDHADGVIPIFALREAINYERTGKTLAGFLSGKDKRRPVKPNGGAPAVAAVVATPAPPSASGKKTQVRAAAAPSAADQQAVLAAAAGHLAEIAHGTPGLPLGRQTVVRAFSKRMPEFKATGNARYLGFGTYARMIETLADTRKDLQLIKYKNGGIAILAPGKEEE
jgi:uncharacterized LabA/DUF88 family protein